MSVAGGAVVAGLVQGMSGFGFSMTAIAVWAWLVPPQLVAPMAVFGSLIGQMIATGANRRGFSLRRVLPFILGGLAGIPFGVMMLRVIDPTLFKFALGALLVVYCPTMLFVRNLPRITVGGRAADAGIGLIGGIMGGLSGVSGAAPTLWCTLRGWEKDAQRAVLQSFNLSMQAVTMATYAATGVLTPEAWTMFGIIALASPIPTLIGIRLYSRMDEIAFRRVVLVLLSCAGATLLLASAPILLARLG